MKPIRLAIANMQKDIRLNGDSKEKQYILDLLCKLDDNEKFDIPSVGSSAVSVKLRICNLNICGGKPLYEISTEVYIGAMSVEKHLWNKSVKIKCKLKAEEIFNRWKNQLIKEKIYFWIQ